MPPKKASEKNPSRGLVKPEKTKSVPLSLSKGVLRQLNITPAGGAGDSSKSESSVPDFVNELSKYATVLLRILDQAVANNKGVNELMDMLSVIARPDLDSKLTEFSKKVQQQVDSQNLSTVSVLSIDVLLSKINIEMKIARINEKSISTTMIYLLKLTQLKNLYAYVETAGYSENAKSGHQFLIFSTMASLHLQLASDPQTETIQIKAGYANLTQIQHRETALQFADKAISILREQRFHLENDSLMLGYSSLIPLFIAVKDEKKTRDLLLSLMVMRIKYPDLNLYPTLSRIVTQFSDLGLSSLNRTSLNHSSHSNLSPNSITSSSDVSTPVSTISAPSFSQQGGDSISTVNESQLQSLFEQKNSVSSLPQFFPQSMLPRDSKLPFSTLYQGNDLAFNLQQLQQLTMMQNPNGQSLSNFSGKGVGSFDVGNLGLDPRSLKMGNSASTFNFTPTQSFFQRSVAQSKSPTLSQSITPGMTSMSPQLSFSAQQMMPMDHSQFNSSLGSTSDMGSIGYTAQGVPQVAPYIPYPFNTGAFLNASDANWLNNSQNVNDTFRSILSQSESLGASTFNSRGLNTKGMDLPFNSSARMNFSGSNSHVSINPATPPSKDSKPTIISNSKASGNVDVKSCSNSNKSSSVQAGSQQFPELRTQKPIGDLGVQFQFKASSSSTRRSEQSKIATENQFISAKFLLSEIKKSPTTSTPSLNSSIVPSSGLSVSSKPMDTKTSSPKDSFANSTRTEVMPRDRKSVV